MIMDILKVENLSVVVNERKLIDNISLTVKTGEVHVIMGPNGSGKSTLANTLMGDPRYKIEEGRIKLNNEDISNRSINERANLGVFLAFQNPIEIEGLSIMHFLRMIYKRKFNKTLSNDEVKALCDRINLPYEIIDRQLNFNLSGGEKKKLEFLQMLLLKPKIRILDEIDAGIDIDSFKRMIDIIKEQKNESATILITHQINTARMIEPDRVHLLIDGKIRREGRLEILKEIENNGYGFYRK